MDSRVTVTIQYGGGPIQDAAALGVIHPKYGAIADAAYNSKLAAAPPRVAAPRATVRYPGQYSGGDFLSGGSATIQNADGNSGPGF